MKKYSFPRIRPLTVFYYLILQLCMICLNYALPWREPLAFGLFFAALTCGLNPFLCAAEYLLASFPALSWYATLSAAVQSAFLLLVFLVYRRIRRPMGSERLAYAVIGQLPFVLLFPHEGYALLSINALWQKAVLAAVFSLFSMLTEGGLHALIFRAFRCRLTSAALLQLTLTWTLIGMGLATACGEEIFLFFAVAALFFAVILFGNATAFPFSVVLALPLCMTEKSLLPCSVFILYCCIPLLFLPYGRLASALSLIATFLVVEYMGGLFALSPLRIVLKTCACVVPALTLALLPQRLVSKLKDSLLFYRARTLPRVAINRNRRAVGEQLYEVSALFREISQAFSVRTEEDTAKLRLRDGLVSAACKNCRNRQTCAVNGTHTHLDKLVAVGCVKGKVSLVDMPEPFAAACPNSTGILFALNQKLVEYRRYALEQENARNGRILLSEQAMGVSEILKNIALEQSEEFSFSNGEEALERALSAAGVLSSEIFLYGEGAELTVSMTVSENTNGKRLCEIAGNALQTPLTLSDKIPLTADKACFVLKRKANFDAAFGVASKPKAESAASGDTHSILKIDERKFLVALSDGMGSGEGARTVSDNTLNLIESFYKAKMPSEIILSTVNKLLSYSSEETFSCLDLAAVDLDTGVADVIKIGSPTGFVLSHDTLRVLEGQSLPMGMLETIHPVTLRTELSADDFLLFMSDGVADAWSSSTELYAYLSELKPLNPQSLAEEILAVALNRYGERAEDDMTVIAVRLLAA